MQLGRVKGILYIGPYKVKIHAAYYGGMYCISTKNIIIGYTNLYHGMGTVLYNINHLTPWLQSMYRNPAILKQWSAYMILDKDVWTGKLEYIMETNNVCAYLIRH